MSEQASIRVACLSLQPGAQPGRSSIRIDGRELTWETMPVAAEIETLKGRLAELLADYDAVAVDGISSRFRVGEHHFKHEALWHALGIASAGARFCDGSALRATLERHLTRQAAEKLAPDLRHAPILVFSGLTRYGVADVLSSYSRRIVFGDLLYGFRLG